MEIEERQTVYKMIENLSSPVNYKIPEVAVILAAGHGKRIKSQKSKMLHKIWGVPTVERVLNACRKGIENINVIVVVGIKAKDVIEVISEHGNTALAFQEVQNGTGHAVQVALEKITDKNFDGIVYVLPGDMGLIDADTMMFFRKKFISTGSDMMVLTGIYEGDPKENAYGRIIRVKAEDENGVSSGKDYGKVVEIKEYKDILALPDNSRYRVNYNGKAYSYTKQELIENNEFNSGVYAFMYKKLTGLVHSISSNNAQKEIYITDLIALFNTKGYSVTAVSPLDPYVVMGFNNKSVLKEMENVARKKVYDKIKDIIEIDDPDDFFIAEEIVEQIIEMDAKGTPLDIRIGKGVHIDKGAKLNYNLDLKKDVYIGGNLIFGTNVTVHENVHLSSYPYQKFEIGNYVEILTGNILKGNIIIGDHSRIESSVRMTGNDNHPLRIGKKVLIKGTSYIFGSIIEDGAQIEHSVIICKKVVRLSNADGSAKPVKFYLPAAEGIDAITDL